MLRGWDGYSCGARAWLSIGLFWLVYFGLFWFICLFVLAGLFWFVLVNFGRFTRDLVLLSLLLRFGLLVVVLFSRI